MTSQNISLPSFDESPPVVLVTGGVEFFVEEAATKALEKLGRGGVEVLRFEDDAPAEAVADALLNRSLFSARRLVQFDISRLLGTEAPGKLLVQAAEAWREGTPAGRRKAFKFARALLSALDLPSGGSAEDQAEAAETAAKRVRKKDEAGTLAEILKDLPEEKGNPAALASALRHLLERPNDGLVALVTAVSPPPGVDLVKEIEKKGLHLPASVGEDAGPALARLARARAKERDVTLEADAIERLRVQTDADPALFAAELGKLLDWAGPGGRIGAADVRQNVEDEASEDVYPFYEAIGRRDAGDALARLERLFSGRTVRAGKRELDKDANDVEWPTVFLGMLTSEVRRMLLIRCVLEGRGDFDRGMEYPAFLARIVPRLSEPVAPFGRSPFAAQGGAVSGFVWYMAAKRAARYSTSELARALARAADVDILLKTSAPERDVMAAYVAELIAGS
jgi:DNA polymerase III delta subunit